jgi:hypothetical protein
MSVNFFDEKCLTKTDAGLFGIYDSTDLSQATLDFTQASKWVCSVQNEAGLMLEFRAIDHCVVILREDGNQEKSCDAMLTYSENIVFIELKEKAKHWKEEGIIQLEQTIKEFVIHHELSDFKYKRAFVANRKHPNFQVINNETAKKFWDKYRVRLNVQANIVIK